MAARALKISVHLRFDPKFTVEFEHFDQKYFRQAYYPCASPIRHHVAAFYFPRKIQGHGWDVNYDNELLERGRENLHEWVGEIGGRRRLFKFMSVSALLHNQSKSSGKILHVAAIHRVIL